MAGKKKAKKAAKKAPAKKAAKKAPAKKAGKKKAGAKRGGAKKVGMQKITKKTAPQPPGRSESKGKKTGWEDDRAAAEQVGKAWEKNWAKIVAKSWTDPEFKQQLLENPLRILTAEGMPLLHDVEIRIVPGEGGFVMEIPLPERPGDLEGEVIDDLIADLTNPEVKPKKCVMSSCCC